MIYRTDYHIHSLYSDGKAEPDEYIAAAAESGIKEIGFSEHLNLLVPGQQWCMNTDRIPEYLSAIEKLAGTKKDIAIRVGQHFNEAYSLLRDAGYIEMCAFKNRERYMIPADFSNI
jgi:histidinol phosphatase-like PHP family hydrolase